MEDAENKTTLSDILKTFYRLGGLLLGTKKY
jgi:hypothetical protein